MSVKVLIKKLGGPTAVARACSTKLTGGTVSAWILRDQIPWRWRARIKHVALQQGIKLTAREERALSVE